MMLARKTEAVASFPVLILISSFRRLRLEREMVSIGLSLEKWRGGGVRLGDVERGNAPGIDWDV